MSNNSAQGIQALLEAEKEAAKIVAKARQYRVQRLKEATAEARKEIDALRAQKEREFVAIQQQSAASSLLDKVNQETEEKLTGIQSAYQQNKGTVVEKLMETVCRVQSTIHVWRKK